MRSRSVIHVPLAITLVSPLLSRLSAASPIPIAAPLDAPASRSSGVEIAATALVATALLLALRRARSQSRPSATDGRATIDGAGEEQALRRQLADANASLKARNEELEAQKEELREHSERLRAQSHELRAKSEELLAQKARLAEQNLALERGSQMKSQFLASMSHELRTPLNAVIGFSEILLDDALAPLTPQQQQQVRDIHSAGQQLMLLINDVLDLSKVEAGRMELLLRQFDVSEPVREAVSMLAAMAMRKRIVLVGAVRDGAGWVTADPDRVRQVLLNLLSNAVKFTPEGGRVTVTASDEGDRVVVRVRDTGIGMAPDAAGRLFQPFVQIDSGMARRYGGTGLGLAISKRLVEAMGGEIGFESALGEGSLFWFALPGAPTDRPGATQPPVVDARAAATIPGTAAREVRASPSRPSLLVVDDSSTNRRVIRAMLGSFPCELHEAPDGETAIRIARTLLPAAILMDLQMPGMDGLEAARSLRRDRTTASIPVIALTGRAMAGDEERALAAGCVSYIAKPVGRESLIRAVDAALRGSGAWLEDGRP